MVKLRHTNLQNVCVIIKYHDDLKFTLFAQMLSHVNEQNVKYQIFPFLQLIA